MCKLYIKKKSKKHFGSIYILEERPTYIIICTNPFLMSDSHAGWSHKKVRLY